MFWICQAPNLELVVHERVVSRPAQPGVKTAHVWVTRAVYLTPRPLADTTAQFEIRGQEPQNAKFEFGHVVSRRTQQTNGLD